MESVLGAAIRDLLLAGAVAHGGPHKSPARARQGRKAQIKSGGLGGYNPTNRSDMALTPPSLFNVPKSVPRNVASILAWDSVKINSTITPVAASVVETNFSFSLNLHPQHSSWQALFDQWSIPKATVEFDSQVSPGGTSPPPILYTALDFDNASAITTVQALEDYSSSEAVPMGPGRRIMRSVRPCVKLAAATSSNLGVSGPVWCDSAQPTTLFFAIRSMVANGTDVTPINVTTTIWYCFRNQV